MNNIFGYDGIIARFEATWSEYWWFYIGTVLLFIGFLWLMHLLCTKKSKVLCKKEKFLGANAAAIAIYGIAHNITVIEYVLSNVIIQPLL